MVDDAAHAPSPAAPDVDPDLLELARQLDYYKTDGTPDLERVAKHDQLIQRASRKFLWMTTDIWW